MFKIEKSFTHLKPFYFLLSIFEAIAILYFPSFCESAAQNGPRHKLLYTRTHTRCVRVPF